MKITEVTEYAPPPSRGLMQAVHESMDPKKVYTKNQILKLIDEDALCETLMERSLKLSSAKRVSNAVGNLLLCGRLVELPGRKGATPRYRMATFSEFKKINSMLSDGDCRKVVFDLPQKEIIFQQPPEIDGTTKDSELRSYAYGFGAGVAVSLLIVMVTGAVL